MITNYFVFQEQKILNPNKDSKGHNKMEIPADYDYEGETYSPLQTKFTSIQENDHYSTFSVDILKVVNTNLSFSMWKS